MPPPPLQGFDPLPAPFVGRSEFREGGGRPLPLQGFDPLPTHLYYFEVPKFGRLTLKCMVVVKHRKKTFHFNFL